MVFVLYSRVETVTLYSVEATRAHRFLGKNMQRRKSSVLVSAAFAMLLSLGTVVAPVAQAAEAKPRVFANCTQMHKVYPHGVGKVGARDKGTSKNFKPVTTFKRDTALYKANAKSDRDKDGIACEKR